TIGWRFENPKMAARFPLQSMGETAENVAEKWKLLREEQDFFPLFSQVRATAARARGLFDREIVPIAIPQKKGDAVLLTHDESPRPETTIEALPAVPPVFRKGGTVTAGNSSPLNDGASAVLVASEEAVRAN